MNAIHTSSMASESKTYQQVAAFLQRFPAASAPSLPAIKDVGLSQNLFKNSTENILSLYQKSLAGLRILIADNNEITQMVAEQLLSDAEAHVYVADKGADVISACLSVAIDVVITGVELEDMEGEALLSAIRKNIGNLPVLLLDSSAKEYEEIRASGFTDAISFPIERTELYQKVSLSTLD